MYMTGYVSPIVDGNVKTVEHFAEMCSRAFGIYSQFQDENCLERHPEVFLPNPLYKEKVIELSKKYNDFVVMTDKQKESLYKNHVKTSKAAWTRIEKTETEHLNKLRNFYAQIEQWNAPKTHQSLKDFMLTQIRAVLAKNEDLKKAPYPQYKPCVEWLKEYEKFLMTELEYYKDCADKEEKHAAEKTLYVKQLRESFK